MVICYQRKKWEIQDVFITDYYYFIHCCYKKIQVRVAVVRGIILMKYKCLLLPYLPKRNPPPKILRPIIFVEIYFLIFLHKFQSAGMEILILNFGSIQQVLSCSVLIANTFYIILHCVIIMRIFYRCD